MFRLHGIGFVYLLITYLSVILAEPAKKFTFTTGSSISWMNDSSSFKVQNEDIIMPEYDREYNVSQRWKRIETSFIKIFTTMYNESLPFFIQVNRELDISSVCKRDLMKMLTGMKDFKYWAVKMFDSFGKIPSGIETGTFNELGDFDQCLEVDVPGHFQGQYCNLDFIIPLPKRQPYVSIYTEIPEVMNAIKPDGFFKVFGQYGRILYVSHTRTAICVPSTCSKGELQKIANKAVQSMDLPFGLDIPNCEILKKEVKFDRIEIMIMLFLGLLLLLEILATAFDVYLESNGQEDGNNYLSSLIKYLLCFSLYTNAKRLFKPDTDKDSVKVFHGMRVMTSLWVISVHTSTLINYNAVSALLLVYQKILPSIPFQVIFNGFINVQTFFFMSGTLHALRVLKMKEISVKKHILRRIWRLAPTFMIVIGLAILMPHLGSGPVWKETIEDELTKNCRNNWWRNLLFINNFTPAEDMCFSWLWYIGVEFQLYVLSLLVLIPMRRNPVLGFSISILMMISGMVISAAMHVYYNLTPMLTFAFANPEDVNYFLNRGYFRPYLHCSSVCIGIAVGYFLANKPAKLRIPPIINAFLCLTSFIVGLLILFGVYRWNQGMLPSIGVSVLYAVGSKIMWATCLAWFTISCTTGNGGFITKILSNSIFTPLARMSYMVYLTHSLIHYLYIGSTRLHIRLDGGTGIYMYAATVILSFLAASVLTLMFESPFIALDKLLFAETKAGKAEQTKILNGEKLKAAILKAGDIHKDINKKVS